MLTFCYSAPIETWFALLKTGDLNPQGIQVGKRKFKALAELLMAKAAAIKQSTIVKLWRRSVLALFNYLALKKVCA